MVATAVGSRARPVVEPQGIRPAVLGASGDVWQRQADLLWRRGGDLQGRAWREVCEIEGQVRHVRFPYVPLPAYTDEVPTSHDG